MKFLCDSCKAKYQIADEKVAGKTVRMKCRKCGHLIEIRANSALAEATQFRSLPAEELSRVQEAPGGEGDDEVSSPGVAAPAPAAPPRAGVAPKPATAAAPRVGGAAARPASPLGAGPQAPKPAASPIRPATTAATAPRAAAPRAGAGPLGNGTGTAALQATPAASASAGGGLADAFNRVVADEPTKVVDDSIVHRAVELAAAGGAEEWYVGVNGTPIGPIRLSEMKSRSAAGEVTEESLVWRDTFDEWVALRTVPELAEMFRAVQNERHSLRPAAAGATGRSGRFPAPAPKDKPATGATSSPGLEAAPVAKSDEGANGALFGLAPAVDPSADPFASPAPATNGSSAAHLNGNGAANGAARVSLADPFGDPFAAPAATSSAPVMTSQGSDESERRAAAFVAPVAIGTPSIDGPRPVAPARIPIAAWIAIVLALATGVVAGSILFSKPPEQTVKIVTVIASAAPTPTAPVSVAAVDPGSPDTAPTDPTKVDPANGGRKTPTVGGIAKATTTATGAGGGAPALVLPPITEPTSTTTIPGPSPTTQGPGPNSSETIPASRLQDVVNSNRNGLRRACWEPALSARGGAAGSAKVTIVFTVGGNGRVKSASPSGGESYPTLGPCIAGRIRNWTFPSGFADTPSQASFSFVSQG
jgi:predicted Zn finger-like uncharacterized protein